MNNEQKLKNILENYNSIKPDEINSDLIEYLNHVQITKEKYHSIFDTAYNTANNYYKNCTDSNLKEAYFDVIAEMMLACKYQVRIKEQIYEIFQKKLFRYKYYDVFLKHFKYYNYLNKNKNLVKIFVGYIKPSFLFKTDILTPIHLGRNIENEATKDGYASDDDLKWLHENCIGDNDYNDNISNLNHRIGFFTGSYLAWKNYEKIGNPQYFGSFGHRRLLFPNCLSEIEKYDLILPIKKSLTHTLKEEFISNNNILYYDIITNTISELYPDELEQFNKYLNGYEGYFAEIYIMKKELFFDFCEWMYKTTKFLIDKYKTPIKRNKITNAHMKELLSKYLKIEEEKFKFDENNIEKRDLAYIIEILTGYYLFRLTEKQIKYKEVAVFEPHYFSLLMRDKSLLNIIRQDLKKSFKESNK